MRWVIAVAALSMTMAAQAQAQAQTQPATRDFDLTQLAGHGFDGDHGFEGGPNLFSVAVPPSNYAVTVTLGDPARATVTTIKAESRRLMLDAVRTRPGEIVMRRFIVNVRTPALTPPPANAPGGSAVRLKPREVGSRDWDDRLTLEILGPAPALRHVTVSPVEVPTLFLLGDSTVTDQPAEPAASWGQMLPVFLSPTVAVANHAESGETLKSFLTELRLDKVLASAKPGDIAMIQFGHNDQKAQWPQTYVEAATTFRAYLRTYIAELRRRGVTPILVTSPERRQWTADGHIRPTLGDYPAAVRAVGAEEHVPVIDLNADSIRFYEALGQARAPLAFNDGGRDATHHDNYGAWVLARDIAERMRTVPSLARFVRSDLPPFDPARPPAPERFRLAASTMHSTERPAGN
ncbi:rhamnogalacturonan acetylesterase [Sphingomonas fuzhouensis]|uniref:rhamnogalacturonan acetylesterase n=1 Tax=Sphingomonas fuzhouensis TaxID=3106033 RepID=UPI002AFFE17B|nr:rhamnogalacturonan acetylesterase [Sphingomonas sp. SGZ-02]